MTSIIEPKQFSHVTGLLRSFFLEKGFLEVHTQNRLSILAACEDPTTVATYEYNGQIWPLPQTGQMWLEYELLRNPSEKGFFCLSTSYRQEPNPVEGRHETIFPMFEFEFPGDMRALKEMEIELCKYLHLPELDIRTYADWCEHFGVEELGHEEEEKIGWGMITEFPNHTSPFWNMAQFPEGFDKAKKIDVILGGMETIGSAERSTDERAMRYMFHDISDGGYAKLLFDKFGTSRVTKELNEFLEFDFIPRVGGGIGVTRLISAMNGNLA